MDTIYKKLKAGKMKAEMGERGRNGRLLLSDINFRAFCSVALYGRRERGQAPTLPQLNLAETYVAVHYCIVR